MEQKKAAEEERKKRDLETKEAQASARLGAGAKGYAQRRRAKLEQQQSSSAAVSIQAKFRGRKERTNPAAEANVRRARAANDPQVQASEYLKQHKLLELFELLGQALVREQPDDPREYLVSYLENTLMDAPDKTSPLNFFTDTDVNTLFSMYDVAKTGITQQQCREALSAIGLDAVAVPTAAERIDLATFRGLCGLH